MTVTPIVTLDWRKEGAGHYTTRHGEVRIHIRKVVHASSPIRGAGVNLWVARTQPSSEPIWGNTVAWFTAPTLKAAQRRVTQWANTEGRGA